MVDETAWPKHGSSQRTLVLGRLTDAFAGVLPTVKSKREKLKKELVRAGYYHRKAIDEYLALRNAAIVAWMIFIGAAVVVVGSVDAGAASDGPVTAGSSSSLQPAATAITRTITQ